MPKATKSGSKSAKTAKKNSHAKTAKKTTKMDGGKAKPTRFFKEIDPKTGNSIGRYRGATPKQAASKASTKKAKRENVKKGEYKIYVRESTQGGGKKIYGYVTMRTRLREPQVVTRVDNNTGETKKVVYKYRNTIKKIAVPDQVGGIPSRPAKKPAKKASGSKTAKKTTKKSASKSTKKTTAKKTTKKPATKTTKKPATKATKKPAAKTTKKSAKKTTKKTKKVTA